MRRRRTAEDRLRAKTEWQKFTRAGKVFAPIIMSTMIISFFVVVLSISSVGRPTDHRVPLYLTLMIATSIIHLFSMIVCAGVVANLKNRMTPEAHERLDTNVGYVFLFIMGIFWWATVIVAFVARPSCAEGSSWLETAAALHSKATLDDVIQYCHMSIIALSLSTLNAVLVLVCGIASALVPFSRIQPQPLLGRLCGLPPPGAPPPSYVNASEPGAAGSGTNGQQQSKVAIDFRKEGLPIFIICIPLVLVQFFLILALKWPPAPAKLPPWFSLTNVAATVHIFGFTWLTGILQGLKARFNEKRMAQIQPWLVRTFVVAVICVWIGATTRIFQAHPTCTPGSGWVLSLFPNSTEIEDERTPEGIALARCPTSIAVVVFTVIISVLLTASLLAVNVGPEVLNLVRRVRTSRSQLPQEEQNDVSSSIPLLQDEESATPRE